MQLLKNPWYVSCATVFGLGYLPKMPGTWGSLAALPLAYALYGCHWSWQLAGLLFITLFSYYTIAKTEALWGNHDSSHIVIDEVAGLMFGLALVQPHFLSYSLGFVIFRLLDIKKPWLIGWCDRNVKGAWGTLLDDLLAGVLTALLLYVLPV